MVSRLRKTLKSERGGSELIALLFGLPLIIFAIFTVLDIGNFMGNVNTLRSVAQNGARSVAIVGGKGTATQATALEARYGTTTVSACDSLVKESKAYQEGVTTPLECQVIKNALVSKLYNTEVEKVSCTPVMVSSTEGRQEGTDGSNDAASTSTGGISSPTTCTITWHYGGTPLSFFQLDAAIRGHDSLYNQSTTATAEAEVDLSNTSLVARR